MDIFFYEAFQEEETALRRHLPSHITAGFTSRTIQESFHADPPSAFISIRTQSVIPAAWADRIEGILTRSTGFDHMKGFLRTAGRTVPTGYLPFYCSRSVAEQAMLLWMGLLRKLPLQERQFRSFERNGLTGWECRGRILLVVGVGNIGYEIYGIGKALGMETLGVDIVRKHPDVSYVDIGEGLLRADVIVCAMNLTRENRGCFSYDLLKRTKLGTVFVNIARGELSPTADLLRLLDERHLGGVGLDVYEDESRLGTALRAGITDHDRDVRACLELSFRDNAILTPHNAFNTMEALERKAGQSVQQAVSFLNGSGFIWVVPEEG